MNYLTLPATVTYTHTRDWYECSLSLDLCRTRSFKVPGRNNHEHYRHIERVDYVREVMSGHLK